VSGPQSDNFADTSSKANIHERNCCLLFAIDRTGDFVPTEIRNEL